MRKPNDRGNVIIRTGIMQRRILGTAAIGAQAIMHFRATEAFDRFSIATFPRRPILRATLVGCDLRQEQASGGDRQARHRGTRQRCCADRPRRHSLDARVRHRNSDFGTDHACRQTGQLCSYGEEVIAPAEPSTLLGRHTTAPFSDISGDAILASHELVPLLWLKYVPSGPRLQFHRA